MRALAYLLRDWTPRSIASGGSLVVALAGVVVGIARLALPVALPPAATHERSPLPAPATRARATDDAAILSILEADPFAGAAPSKASADAPAFADSSVAAPAVAPAAPDLRLQGVAMLPGGPRAVIAVAGRPAQLLRPGQTVIDGLRVGNVGRDTVTIVGADTTYVLALHPARPVRP